MDMKKLNKGLITCAGPDCGEECPYRDETKGGKTCRAWLLTDAQVAIAAKEAENAALAEEVERITAERDNLRKECEELKEYALALEKEGQEARANVDKLRKECDTLLGKLNYLAEERDKLRTDNDDLEAVVKTLQERCQVQQNEINALLLRAGEDKTDRKSVSDMAEEVGKLVAHANYQQGRADALWDFIEKYFFEAVAAHE